MIDNFLVMTVYIITGYHAVYIYLGALISIYKKFKKMTDDK